MKTAVTIPQTVVRLAAPILIVLGLLFWSGNALTLVPVHMLLGIAVVLSLWALAAMALVVGVSRRLAGLALAWGIVVPLLGLAQTGLLVGNLHWLIQLLHLLVGLTAIAQAENLARRLKGFAHPVTALARQPGAREPSQWS